MSEYNFGFTLERLHDWHSRTHDTIQLYTDRVRQICVGSLDAARIRHAPITSRIKAWASAREKIRMQEHKQPTLKEMQHTLHDFGGIRISVYFPGDVSRVVNILEESLNVVRKPDKKKMRNVDEATFMGYKATHITVKLKDTEIPKDKDAWKDVQVEIQIATLVMNVWSDIEHDMIYKPSERLNEGVSEDERRMLDLINGIVLTGEVALRQLEACTKERRIRAAQRDDTVAADWHGLSVWIREYHRDNRKQLGQGPLGRLKQLHGILKATGDNKHKSIYTLLDALYTGPRLSTQFSPLTLPDLMLKRFCKDLGVTYATRPEPEHKFKSYRVDLANTARDTGWFLVYSLSIAIYIGMGDRFTTTVASIRRARGLQTPSLVRFLDLLHPTEPACAGDPRDTCRMVISFCEAVTEQARHDPDLSICFDLPGKGLIAQGCPPDEPYRIVFPSLLQEIFPLEQRNGQHSRAQSHWTEIVDLQVIDRIRDHIDRHSPYSNDMLVEDVASNTAAIEPPRPPMSEQFFVPVLKPSRFEGRWRLMGLPSGELEPRLVGGWKDEYRLRQFPGSTYPNGEPLVAHRSGGGSHSPEGVHCDALELAYRMYPPYQHSLVFQAWEKVRGSLTAPEGGYAPPRTPPRREEAVQTAPLASAARPHNATWPPPSIIKREPSPSTTPSSSPRPPTAVSNRLGRWKTFHNDGGPLGTEGCKQESPPFSEPGSIARSLPRGMRTPMNFSPLGDGVATSPLPPPPPPPARANFRQRRSLKRGREDDSGGRAKKQKQE
ncbi:hypothetical protein F4802DRAFT_334725 [Xylaria palmicola]|nr:hypothetical protein F4802DRAFT_334725 [Xylaria palmicola]